MLYRLLSFVVNFFAAFIGMSLLFSFAMIAAAPGAAIALFLMAGVLIYTWYANVFSKKILTRNETISKKEREWLIVNGIIALVFCVIILTGVTSILLKPILLQEVIKNLPTTGTSESAMIQAMTTMIKVFGLATFLLLIHIVWTFMLLRKYKTQVV